MGVKTEGFLRTKQFPFPHSHPLLPVPPLTTPTTVSRVPQPIYFLSTAYLPEETSIHGHRESQGT